MKTIKVGILNTACVKYFKPYLEDLKSFGYSYEILDCPEFNEATAEEMAALCKSRGIRQVLANGMTEMPFQGAINERLAPHAAGADVINLFKNKFIQRTYVPSEEMWFRGCNLSDPDEEILNQPREYPCMMKATALYLGSYVYKISDQQELKDRLVELRSIDEFVEFDRAMKDIHQGFPDDLKPDRYPSILFERALDLGNVRHFSCDVFTTDTYCQVFSLREEQYFRNNIKMGYLFPPPDLSRKMLENIQGFAAEMGEKMVARGLRWHFFNMEIFYTEQGEVILTEVNILYNINYVHVLALTDKANLFKLIFDLQFKKVMGRDEIPYFGLLEGKYDKALCLQSVMQVVNEGAVGDYIDYDEVRKYDNTEEARVLGFVGPEERVEQSQIPEPGFDCIDIWFTAESVEQVYAKDKELRTQVMKNTDIEAVFPYPEVGSQGEKEEKPGTDPDFLRS